MPQDILPTTSLPPPHKRDVLSFPSGITTFLAQTIPTSRRDPLLEIIAQQPFFAGLNHEQLGIIRELAMELHYGPDEWIFREGDPANRFFIILKGYVSLELRGAGGTIPIRTLGPGDDIGWAWLFPPYYMHFSARTTGPVKAVFFYATRLREVCEQDHDLGYWLTKRAAEIVVQHLSATRKLISQAAQNDYE
jgi:CRP-like cAMP-binding protein